MADALGVPRQGGSSVVQYADRKSMLPNFCNVHALLAGCPPACAAHSARHPPSAQGSKLLIHRNNPKNLSVRTQATYTVTVAGSHSVFVMAGRRQVAGSLQAEAAPPVSLGL